MQSVAAWSGGERTLEALAVQDPFDSVWSSLASGESTALLRIITWSVLMGAWALWLWLAEVSIYVESEAARLEQIDATCHIQPETEGRIQRNELSLGRRVVAGEVLVQLDTNATELRIDEIRATLAATEERVRARKAELQSVLGVQASRGDENEAAVREAAALMDRSETRAAHLAAHAEGVQRLLLQGMASPAEQAAAATEVAEARARFRAATAERDRRRQEIRVRNALRSVELARIRTAIIEAEGKASTLRASLAIATSELENHSIRSPCEGELAAFTDHPVGARVGPGETLATVLAQCDLRMRATFAAGATVGRLSAGAPVRIHFEGFPSIQFGVSTGWVSKVASESLSGGTQVEIELDPDGENRIPLQHGLPARVEALVERVSPLTLLLRAAGSLVVPASSFRRNRDHISGMAVE